MVLHLLLSLFLLSLTASGQTTRSFQETPLPADALPESIGVNIHMTYGDTAYGNVVAVQRMLSALGVRHVRDGAKYYPADPNYNLNEYQAYGAISSLDIGFDLILNQSTTPTPIDPSAMATLQALAATEKVTVDYYEGPNEIDIQGDPNWPADTRNFMQAIYSALKSNPSTAAISLLGNTLAGSSADWTTLGNMTAFEDYGNIHPYANTQYPSYNFASATAQEKLVSGSQTICVTESGWSNAMQATDNSPNVNEDVSSRYVGRLFFETLLQGWPRTYVYELVDEKPDPGLTSFQEHFGLFRNDYSAKPAATVIANMIELMSDKGAAHALQPLSYSLETTSANVHHLLFQKRDGSYWLALWQEVSDWKGWNAQGTAVVNSDVLVTVTLREAAASLQAYVPLESTYPTYSFTNRDSATFMVPDHPLLVEIAFARYVPSRPRPPRIRK
jgi:hypothetical protein